jgi:hypothetical protein
MPCYRDGILDYRGDPYSVAVLYCELRWVWVLVLVHVFLGHETFPALVYHGITTLR